MPKSTKSPAEMEHQSSDDEEDVLEMERNFALLSKKSTMQTSAEDEEEMRDEDASSEEDEAEPEEDEDHGDEDESGSDEDEADSNPEDEGVSNDPSHTEGNLKKGTIRYLCNPGNGFVILS